MATTANIYIVDNDVVWRRLNALAAAHWAAGSPGELLYLNALIGDAATTHLAGPAEQDARLRSLTAHVTATADMGGLHGPFLSLLTAAVRRGDGAAIAAAAATWQQFGDQAARSVAGAVPIYDTASRALVLADPAHIASALPQLPTGLSDTKGIVNFLDGIDRRIHDAFGDPHSSDAAFDAATASVVSGLNEAAVTIAQMAVIGMLVPGGQAIGAILLVGAGVVAVGAAAVSLFGTLVDLFTNTNPAQVTVSDPSRPPYQPGDQAQPPADPAPPATDTTTTDTTTTNTTTTDTSTTDTDTSTTTSSQDTTTTDPGSDQTTSDTTTATSDPGTSDGIPATRDGDPPAGGSDGAPGGGESTGSNESAGSGSAGGGSGETVYNPLRTQDQEGDQNAG